MTEKQQSGLGKPERLLQEWRSRLIDLSAKNRLIYYRPNRESSLRFVAPKCEEIFQRLILQEKAWRFWMPPEESELARAHDWHRSAQGSTLPVVAARSDELVCEHKDGHALARALRNLHGRAQTYYNEFGGRVLYVTFGTLVWQESEAGNAIRSPLLLIPVELKRPSRADPFVLLPTEEEPVLNPALRVKLHKDFNLQIPFVPETWDVEGFARYMAMLSAMAESRRWSTEADCTLDLLSFQKLSLYADLEENADEVIAHPMIRGFAGEPLSDKHSSPVPDEAGLDTAQTPEETYQILDADSSQQICIQAALRGRSFVMQGPPGTGKSQTIANIIAEFIARGKSVLFVSAKMAALEVVANRLEKAGLGDFCLELHSHKADKREVVKELKRCLEQNTVVPKHHKMDELEKLRTLREELNAYAQSLHKVRDPLAKSMFEVWGELAKRDTVPIYSLNLQNPAVLSLEWFHQCSQLFKRLSAVWQVRAEGSRFPWLRCRETVFTLQTRSKWDGLLKQLHTKLAGLNDTATGLANRLAVKAPSNLQDVDRLVTIGMHLINAPRPELQWLQGADLDRMIKSARDFQTQLSEFKQAQGRMAQSFHHDILQQPSDVAHQILAAWIETAKYMQQKDPDGRNLLRGRHRLATFLKRTHHQVNKWLSEAEELASTLGYSTETLTLAKAKTLARLAMICDEKVKPERHWLEHRTLENVSHQVAEIRPLYERFNDMRREFLYRYEESFFELDVEGLIQRFNSFSHRSIWRWLSPAFHGDRRIITLSTKTAKVPSNVVRDLLKARDLLNRKRHLDEIRSQMKMLLGKHEREYDTDFDSIDYGMKLAREAIELTGSEAMPEELIQCLTTETHWDRKLGDIGKRLLRSIQVWEDRNEEFAGLLTWEPSAANDESADNFSLREMADWVEALCQCLERLNLLVDPILPCFQNDQPQTLATLVSALDEYEAFHAMKRSLKANKFIMQNFFGSWFKGAETNWEELIRALEWTKELKALFGEVPIPLGIIQIATQGIDIKLPIVSLGRDYQEVVELLNELQEGFNPPGSPCLGESLSSKPTVDLLASVEKLHHRVADLQMWTVYFEIKQKLIESGLSHFLAQLERAVPPAWELTDIFLKATYQWWSNTVTEQDPELRTFRGQDHEQQVQEFRALDRKSIEIAAQRTVELCQKRKPRLHLSEEWNPEVAILAHEGAKRRRHLPIYRLFETIPKLLLRIKPCLMMSPLSVSAYLQSPTLRFDLVIFDEASQLFTEEVVGAIYRSKQVILAGDSRQLPPADFFLSLDHGEADGPQDESEYSADDFESVIDQSETIPGMPSQYLRWHYRSRDESLIAFSNSRFYNNRLVTFPSPETENASLGVKFMYVEDGVYDRGRSRKNLREAEVVAEVVFEQLRDHLDKSLMVVALSEAQEQAIWDEIEKKKVLQPELAKHLDSERYDRLCSFDVKNLETVQGDERDVVILSIGYGKDEHKQMHLNFGPLNRRGGERRLNVAITRAREKVIVVSSIKAKDIDLRRTQQEGPRMLFHYLNFAESGDATLSVANPFAHGASESPFEEDVAGEIKALGFEVIRQVGCGAYRIDLGVIDPAHPGRFILGIECDGAMYHSAKTARDRDRLRQEILESLGWKIHRVWSRDWVMQRSTEITKLKNAITEAQAKLLPNDGKANATDGNSIQPVHPSLGDGLNGTALEASADGRDNNVEKPASQNSSLAKLEEQGFHSRLN